MDESASQPPVPDPEAGAVPLADTSGALPASKTTAHALTPPTSEDLNPNKHDDGSSELSELDMDEEDDIGDIEPDHYFGDGKIPVFKPTMDQFRSFSKFIEKVDRHGMKSGIIKVIPPQEWRDALPDLSEAVKAIKVRNPIMQEFAGTHGTYTQANIEKQRAYNLPQWKNLTEESSHQPPAKRGERRRQAAEAAVRPRPARPQPPSANPAADATPPVKRKRGRPPKVRSQPVKQEEVDDDAAAGSATGEPHVPPTPTSPNLQADTVVVETPEKKTTFDKTATPASGRKRQKQERSQQPKSKSVTSRRMNNRSETQEHVDEAAFKSFRYKLENVGDYTPERCRELEEVYWKTVNYGTPMYGADMPGSLFEDRTTSWNVAHLENLLDVLGTKVPGVNTTYLYLGMWKATFAWHLEDVDLYSINYIHFGAPKHWYSISQEDARRFENAMKQLWPQDAKHCDQFLRHKTYLVSPDKLKSQFNITVNKLVHYEGEFVITYPYGYHSGFNMGYNCAESVNFATEPWLDYGRIAKKCYCEADSVWVNVQEIERKLRGEPTPEYYEETDEEEEEVGEVEQMPTPPASSRGRPKAKSRKRKRDEKPSKDNARKVKRVKVRVRLPGLEPCVLCPNDVPFDTLLPTDNGKKAHRLCAQFTPETYIRQEDGREVVCGTANINKERLNFKCNFCRLKRVAFQCDSRKCTRGYHATCANAAGVLVDFGPMPYFVDGVEYIGEGFDFRCRFHRPKRDKRVDIDTLETSSATRVFGKSLQKSQVVHAMFLGGDVFGGVVVANRPQECSVVIDVLPDGDRIEVEWKYLLAPDADQSLRLKPSKDAQPLPQHLTLASLDASKSSRKSGAPEADDAFCDPDAGYKWAEFHTCAMAECRNPHQAKVVLDKPEQLWYYLGKTSTEARPQYTHDPAKNTYNPKSSFLDSVKPPPAPVSPTSQRKTGYSIGYASLPLAPQYNSTYPGRPNYPVYTPQRPVPSPTQGPKPYQYKPKVDVKQIPPYPYGQQVDQWLGQTGSLNQEHQRRQSASGTTSTTAAAGASGLTQIPIARMTPVTTSLDAGFTTHTGSPRGTQASVRPPHYGQPRDSSFLQSYMGQIGEQSQNGAKLDNSPPCSNYYEKIERRYSLQQPMEQRYAYLASPPSTTAAVNPALAKPTSSVEVRLDHLRKYEQYPYLRNAYLRRPRAYVSPYEPAITGRPKFSVEWQEHMVKTNGNINASLGTSAILRPLLIPKPAAEGPEQPGRQLYSRVPQYQTAQQFQQEVSKEGKTDVFETSSSMKQLQQLMHQLSRPGQSFSASKPATPLNYSGGTPYATHSDRSSQAVLSGPPPTSAPSDEAGVSAGQCRTPKATTGSPVRPDYSPISDAGTPSRGRSDLDKGLALEPTPPGMSLLQSTQTTTAAPPRR